MILCYSHPFPPKYSISKIVGIEHFRNDNFLTNFYFAFNYLPEIAQIAREMDRGPIRLPVQHDGCSYKQNRFPLCDI